jgi:hypothetical protein
MRLFRLLVLILAGAFVGVAARAEMKVSTNSVRDEVRKVVEAQLKAFRDDDYKAAYALAARQIRRRFDPEVYELMIKRGYASLAHNQRVQYGLVYDDGEGEAEIRVLVVDADNQRTDYRYQLIKERGVWRVGGVIEEDRSEAKLGET